MYNKRCTKIDYITAGFIQFHENHPFPGRMIEMETSIEVLCIRIMNHPQVFEQKFTLIRRFLGRDLHPSAGFWASETHPFWPHILNMTQNGSAPREGKWAKMVNKVKAARVKELRG